MPGQLGVYLGLTGNRIQAADILYTGFATDFAPSAVMREIATALEGEDPDAVLTRLAAPLDQVPPLKEHRAVIDRCFAPDTIEAIVAALEKEGGAWADQVRTSLLQKAPMSLKVTLRELREAASLDFEDCMIMEYRLVQAFMADRDFFEGVRAVIVDKDNKPNWQPARLADVTPAMVDAYFRPLPRDLTFED
jgi:enoyl-CoA hydratase